MKGRRESAGREMEERMPHYVGNALSLGMLDCLEEGGRLSLRVDRLSQEDAAKKLIHPCWCPWVSCVGHADTARLYSALLGVYVPLRRESTSLAEGDELLVGQYNGPRLPEGAMALPEGAKLRWYLVGVSRSPLAEDLDQEEVRRLCLYTPW